MPLFFNRIKEQLLFFDRQKIAEKIKSKMVIWAKIFFSIFSNMLLNIDIISNAVFYSV